MLRLKGIIYLVISSWIIWHEHGTPKSGNEWTPQIISFAETHPIIEPYIMVIMVLAYIAILVFWIKGVSLTFLMGALSEEDYAKSPWSRVNWKINLRDAFYSSGNNSNQGYSQIERMIKYRESVFQNMSNEVRAEEYKKSAWLDSYAGMDGSNKNVQGTVKYINSKLANMSNETAYKWIKNQKL